MLLEVATGFPLLRPQTVQENGVPVYLLPSSLLRELWCGGLVDGSAGHRQHLEVAFTHTQPRVLQRWVCVREMELKKGEVSSPLSHGLLRKTKSLG